MYIRVGHNDERNNLAGKKRKIMYTYYYIVQPYYPYMVLIYFPAALSMMKRTYITIIIYIYIQGDF